MNESPPDADPVAASPDAAADGWTLYQLSAACDGAERGYAEHLAAAADDAEPLPVAELADAPRQSSAARWSE